MPQTISVAQLRNMLGAMRGATFVTFTARTSARARKTSAGGEPNPHWPVTKIARVNGVIGFNYGSTVRRQQVREGRRPTFKPSLRDWGNRMDPPTPGMTLRDRGGKVRRRRGLCPLYQHKGKFYLDVKVNGVLEARYLDARGRDLRLDQVQAFLPVRKSEAKHQRVKRPIVLRDYRLETIEAITINGSEYRVTP